MRPDLSAPLVLLAVACGGETEPPAPSEPVAVEVAVEPKRHAVLVVIDTLRADAVAAAHTPVLDALAAEGDAVPRAWSGGTWTVPSVISLFTGMPVRQHGADLEVGKIGSYPPIPPVPTLAEVLEEQGFHTTGLYGNTYLTSQLGFDRGFDVWRRTPDTGMAAQVAREVKTWRAEDRQFLYVHLMGPHSPLEPSAEASARWELDPSFLDQKMGFSIGAAKRNKVPGVREAYRAAYHAVVEDTDARLGAILEALGPHRDDAVLIVTSDHGELLGEHDVVGHGWWVYEPLTHVPLVAVGAGDLPETLGTPSIPALLGRALGLDHTFPTPADAALPLVSQRKGKLALSPDGRLKGIWDGGLTVYDLAADPGESTPIAGRDAELDAARAAWEARVPPGRLGEGRIDLHEDTVEALRAMGYLDDEP